MNYAFVKQLLEQVEAFEKSGRALVMEDFAAWLHARSAEHLPSVPGSPPRMSPEAEIGRLLIFLNRYARTYIRLGLAGTPLLTPDDFAYLATVLGHQPLSKTELIAHNVHEKASGNEVIKRLLARELVAEQPHATDRRSKLLTVTEAGMGVLGQAFGRMEQAAQLIAGNLSPAERGQLLYLLQKLNAFHHPIYTSAKAETFEDLLPHLSPGPSTTT